MCPVEQCVPQNSPNYNIFSLISKQFFMKTCRSLFSLLHSILSQKCTLDSVYFGTFDIVKTSLCGQG